ncbi:MAG: sporulation-delaying protein SdpB family protein [Bacillota bacterium]
MKNEINSRIQNFNPLTNVYGLARSFVALGTLITLLFNPTDTLFRPIAGVDNYPSGVGTISLFNLVPSDMLFLTAVKWIFIACLIVIISGWRPRYTGILHWYISYSFHTAAATLDGGDQVAVVIAFLLIPITLVDRRKWHWKNASLNNEIEKVIASVPYFFIRLQVAIIYFHSTIAKLFNEEWRNGTAVYYYLNDPMLGLNNQLLYFVNPILEGPLVVLPTWGTIILQFALFAALFASKNTWKYYLVSAIVMHEIFALMLGLTSFSITMIGAIILYLRPLDQPFNLFKGGDAYRKKDIPALKSVG